MNCLYPRSVYVSGYRTIEVPCGHCVLCKKEKSKSWSLRLMLEGLNWKDSLFITLTYDDEHLPRVLTRYRLNGDEYEVYRGSLVKRDLQLFFKRLRKSLGDRRIKYYACGEYGDHTFRPHYHAIIYGLGLSDIPLIEEAWSLGLTYVSGFGIESVQYVTGYVQKKLYGDVATTEYGNRLPPFSLMSKGLGYDYLREHYHELLCGEGFTWNGIRYPIPRYFWRKVDEMFAEYEAFEALDLKTLKTYTKWIEVNPEENPSRVLRHQFFDMNENMKRLGLASVYGANLINSDYDYSIFLSSRLIAKRKHYEREAELKQRGVL